KEKEEQQMVTDFIEKSLKEITPELSTGSPKTSRAGNLLHLKTSLTGTLHPKSGNVKSVIEKLHPTPAVCGIPKEEANRFIMENENYDREFYTGFLGELNLSPALFDPEMLTEKEGSQCNFYV